MAYTNFQHCTANEYKNIVYNQETNNKIKILFNNVELEDADEYCESFEVVSRVIPNGSKIFMLENLVSQEATLVLHNIDTSIIQDQVSISIGTLVSENTYEYVPIGIYNLQEIPTTDNGKTTIKLRDNSVKLDFNYNAKPLIDEHGGTATKLQILQDICTKAGITCNVSSFIGSSDLIGIYDNTITGRQYVAYLAGSAGAIPIITRDGALDFKYINNLSTIEIPIEIVEQYSNAENFKISRVVYEDAIRKYESGNETYDTLFLDSANPYISSQEQVTSIYNIVNNFEINSFKTGRILGNPAIDSYDLIQITDYDGTIFKTFANNTLRYNGKMINTFASEISFERKKENVSLKSGATFKKWAKTEIDNANAQITIQAGQIEEIEQDLQNPTSTKENKYFDLEDALDSPLIDFSLYGETQQDSTPTPSSPQEIHNVSGDNTIEICGKNIYKGFSFSKTNNGVAYTYNENGSINVNGTASGNSYSMSVSESSPYQFILKKGTYTLSGAITDCRLQLLNDSGTIIAETVGAIIETTFELQEDTKMFLRLRVASGRTVNTTLYPMLEKGSAATEYEAYTGNSQLISLGVENLFDKDNANVLNAYINSSGKILNDNDNRTIWLQINKNTNYTFQMTQKALSTSSSTDYVRIALCETQPTGDLVGSLVYSKYRTSATEDYNYESTFNSGNNSYVAIRVAQTERTDYNTSITTLQLEKGSKKNSYSPYGTTPIELCKIGTYQDYIYKTDKWYWHKEVGKLILDETKTIEYFSVSQGSLFRATLEAGVQDTINYSNYYKGVSNSGNRTNNTFYYNNNSKWDIVDNRYTSVDDYKTWLSTHNTIVYYVLATPTDTEITDTTLLEQLNNLMTLPLYKNMTHITLTPNDLQPTMKIEYYRDTSINNNFVPKEDMTKYYTKTETNAQIQINSTSIQQSVAEIQTTLNSNNEAINSITNQVQTLQSSTSLQINAINTQLENGVEKVKTTTGYTFDNQGLGITKGEEFKNLITDRNQQISSNNKEMMFMGYDDDLKKTVARIPELESRQATIGVHRTETIYEDNMYWTAEFYIGGGN